MREAIITPDMVRERLAAAFLALDIPAEIEHHTSTRLHRALKSGKQYGGACPFEDCSVDTDGFMVWPVLTPRGRHYYCRGCKRSGDILKLVQDIKGLGFSDACKELDIPNPYFDEDPGDNFSKPQVKRRVPKAEKWQLDELQYLNSLYPRARLALQRDRARAYLAGRAVPFKLADTQELGYIPALSEVAHVTPEIERFSRWCDRIIFPIRTPDGTLGYCARSLYLWTPGMDEDKHKKQLDAYNAQMVEQHGEKATRYQVPRWLFTYQQGFFNWQAISVFDTLVFVEGPFDVLACMAVGILNAIPLGTTGLDAGMLPISVCSAVIGLDIDGPGRRAAKSLAKGLKRKGIDVQACTPVDAKDWSAAFRLHGVQGLAPLVEVIEKWLECTCCHVVSNALSETFQVCDGKLLCSHCARASAFRTPAAVETLVVDDGVCLCGVCLDQGIDTPAEYEYGQGDDIPGMYCAEHYPSRLALLALARRSVLQTPGLVLREPYYVSEADAVRVRVLQECIDKARQEYHSQLREYKPVLLPSLPRTQCPIREIDWDNKTGRQVKRSCKHRPTENGFCEMHQLSYRFLCVGARLGYPEVKVPFRWKRETLYRTVWSGVSRWEGAAIDTRRLQASFDFIQHGYAELLHESVVC